MDYLGVRENQVQENKRILFFAEAVTLAHVTRSLVLARALDSSRYEVHFACAEGFDFVFPKDFAITRWPIKSISSAQFIKSLASGERIYDKKTLAGYVAEDIALLNHIKPDIVVGDFRISLSVSAPLCNIPYVNLTNAHWSPYCEERYPLPDHPLSKILGYKIANYLFQLIRPVIFKYHALPINQLRVENKLAQLGDLRDAYTHGDYTLYLDIPELIPIKHLPANHRYIGSPIWSPEIPLPAWFNDLDKSKKNVYVTLGSSGVADRLPEIVSALAEFDVNVLVATAGRSCICSSGNVYVENYLPGVEVIRECDLVICNGGSATVYQAMSEGVPVLGVASNMDQYLTMTCIEKAGAGLLLRSGQVGDRLKLKNSLMDLISSTKYKDGAEVLKTLFGRIDCRKEFNLFIDSISKLK